MSSPTGPRHLLGVALLLATSFALFFSSPTARAQGRVETDARALQKKAMGEDYLATDFAYAQEKLEKAITMCGTAKCPPQLRSSLKRDLAVIQIGARADREEAIANFIEAIKIDSSAALDPDVKTKDLEQAFAEAKKRVATNATRSPGHSPQGDFTHAPVAAQQERTPIPVYAEYAGEEPIVKAKVRYRGFGMTEWKAAELQKIGENGWGAELPCADVLQGTTEYYLLGFNEDNDPVAIGGDRVNPYRVPIKKEKLAEPPHLPNAPPPTQCEDTGDCPPNFPGCVKASARAAADASKVEPVGKEGGEFCEDASECKSNQCVNARCVDYQRRMNKAPRIWVGVAGALDYSFVPSADDVCKLRTPGATPVNDANYYCTRSDGSDYPSRDPGMAAENDSIRLSREGGRDRIAPGGGTLGNIRVMLTVDWAINDNVLLGARLGLVLNNYPGSEAEVDGKRFAMPVHLEARATYVFGKDALAKKGFAPYVFGGAGLAQFETRMPVRVVEDPRAGTGRTERDVDAWRIAGPAFVAIGGGARYAVTPRFALMAGARVNLAFIHAFASSVAPEIGGQIGF
ncbi:MAG: hypothetical protein J0I07_13720 [Myxococcales bacterium]|nr:hypothetical protein [Myxococcales bacterium]